MLTPKCLAAPSKTGRTLVVSRPGRQTGKWANNNLIHEDERAQYDELSNLIPTDETPHCKPYIENRRGKPWNEVKNPALNERNQNWETQQAPPPSINMEVESYYWHKQCSLHGEKIARCPPVEMMPIVHPKSIHSCANIVQPRHSTVQGVTPKNTRSQSDSPLIAIEIR